MHADRYREVVQQREGLWFYHPERRQRGCVCTFFHHRRRWIQKSERGANGRVRAHAGTEGQAGHARYPPLIYRQGTTFAFSGPATVRGLVFMHGARRVPRWRAAGVLLHLKDDTLALIA